mgnify:CR=1 FL=1
MDTKGKEFAKKMLIHQKMQKKRKNEEVLNYMEELKQAQTNKAINENKFMNLLKLNNNIAISLTKAARCIYPVLCSFADFETDDVFHVPITKIASLCGLRPSTVRRGIDNLRENDIVEVKIRHQGKRHFYQYKVKFVRKNDIENMKGKFYPFYESLITSGLWSRLSVRAKVLYLTMRETSEFDHEFYDSYEFLNDMEKKYKPDEFANRKWEVCRLTDNELCSIARIDRKNIKYVFDELEKHKLIDLHGFKGNMQVYLRPEKHNSAVPLSP